MKQFRINLLHIPYLGWFIRFGVKVVKWQIYTGLWIFGIGFGLTLGKYRGN